MPSKAEAKPTVTLTQKKAPKAGKGQIIVPLQIRGGTGKTTATKILAGYLVKQGHRVLMCDLDSNTALSTDFGFHVRDRNLSMGEYILTEADLTKPGLIQATQTPGLDIIPQIDGYPEGEVYSNRKDQALRLMDEKKSDVERAELHAVRVGSLRKMLEPLRSKYDYILLDTVSKEDAIFTQMALYAADAAFITMKPKLSDLPKVQTAVRFLEVARRDNTRLRFAGVLITWLPTGATREQRLQVLWQRTPKELRPFFFNAMIRECDQVLDAAQWHAVPPSALPTEYVTVRDGKRPTSFSRKAWGTVQLSPAKTLGDTTVLDDFDAFGKEFLNRLSSGFFEANEEAYKGFLRHGTLQKWAFMPVQPEKVRVLG